MKLAGFFAETPKLNRDSLVIFVSAVIFFLIGVRPEFIGFDTRFALFAKEMLHNGPAWFPTIYGMPYPDYPATSTFLIYLFSLPLGEVTPFTSILPTAITSALVLVITYRIGAVRSKKWGIYAVLLTLFTYQFLSLSRSISLDQYTSLVTVLCFYVSYSAAVYGKTKRLLTLPLLFVTGFAFRGPMGMLIPMAVTCGFYLWQKDIKTFIITAVCGTVLMAICWVLLLKAAYLQGAESLVAKVVDAQAAGRVSGGSHNYFYYWVRSFSYYSAAYPLAILVLFFQFRRILRQEDDDRRLLGGLAVWVLVILIGLTIPIAKKMRYILPIAPSLSLIASYIFIASSPSKVLLNIRNIFVGFCRSFPFLAFFGVLGLLLFSVCANRAFGAYYVIPMVLLGSLAVLNCQVTRWFDDNGLKELIFVAGAVLSLIVLQAGVIEPVNYELESTLPFVAKVESLQKSANGGIVFYQIGPDSEDIKLMSNMKELSIPEFIKSPTEILNYKQNVYFIARENHIALLPPEVMNQIELLFEGKIGHKECVIFRIE